MKMSSTTKTRYGTVRSVFKPLSIVERDDKLARPTLTYLTSNLDRVTTHDYEKEKLFAKIQTALQDHRTLHLLAPSPRLADIH